VPAPPPPSLDVSAKLDEHSKAIASLQTIPETLEELKQMINAQVPQVYNDDTGTDNDPETDSVDDNIAGLLLNVKNGKAKP